MTAIETAAYALVNFMRANSQPEDSPAEQADEWPIAILTDTQETADELAGLLQTLENAFEAAGHPFSRLKRRQHTAKRLSGRVYADIS